MALTARARRWSTVGTGPWPMLPGPRPGLRRARPRRQRCAAGRWPGRAARLDEVQHLLVGGHRAAARDHRLQTAGGGQARPGRWADRPKLAGSPIATPEPAVTSGHVLEGRAQAQQVGVRTPHPPWPMPRLRPSASRCGARMAASPWATTLWSIRPTLRWHCACSTRTRLGSVMGVSGWFCMPLRSAVHRPQTGSP